MIMHSDYLDLIYHCNMSIDKERLLQEYRNVEHHMSEFSRLSPSWKKAKKVGQYGERCVKELTEGLNGRCRGSYYLQPAGTSILPHKDGKCKCRVNVRLSDDDGVMTIGGSVQDYDFALINVSQYEHSVSRCTIPRLIFSVIYHDNSYEEVKERLNDRAP